MDDGDKRNSEAYEWYAEEALMRRLPVSMNSYQWPFFFGVKRGRRKTSE
jgi:hypothetical protein